MGAGLGGRTENNEVAAANRSAVINLFISKPRLGRKRPQFSSYSRFLPSPAEDTRQKNILTISVDFKNSGGGAPRQIQALKCIPDGKYGEYKTARGRSQLLSGCLVWTSR